MPRTQKLINYSIVGLLVLATVGIGVSGYMQTVSADVISGTATGRTQLRITSDKDQSVDVKIVYTPTATGSKRFYYKERTFDVKAGYNIIYWQLRKIPDGSYSVALTSPTGVFEPNSINADLKIDTVNDISGTFSLYLGTPPTTTAPARAADSAPTRPLMRA